MSFILERSSVGIDLSVMRRTSYATLEFPEDTLVMLSFNFLYTRKPTPACPLLASEWYSRWPLWRVVELSSFLRTSPSPITSHFMLFSFSSSSSSCTCSSFSNVLTLYVAIFSPSPLMCWFFLTQRFLTPPVCSLGGPQPLPIGHRHPCCWGLGALAYLHSACCFSCPTLPRWPMRVGRGYRNWSTKPKAVFTQRSLSDLTLDQSKVRSDKVCVNTLNRIAKPDR